MSAADNRTDAAALLPAEREMAPDEIAEYHGAPQRLRARFHALAAAHAEAAAAVERLSFDCDHWMGVAVARAEAAAAAKTALADALARGEDEGYRRAVADVLRLLVHPSDKAAVRGLLGGRDAALGVDAVDRARAEGEAAGAAREREPRGGAVGGEPVSDDLKPCPFCASPALALHAMHSVICSSRSETTCAAIYYDPREWQQRPAEDALRARAEAAEAEAERLRSAIAETLRLADIYAGVAAHNAEAEPETSGEAWRSAGAATVRELRRAIGGV